MVRTIALALLSLGFGVALTAALLLPKIDVARHEAMESEERRQQAQERLDASELARLEEMRATRDSALSARREASDESLAERNKRLNEYLAGIHDAFPTTYPAEESAEVGHLAGLSSRNKLRDLNEKLSLTPEQIVTIGGFIHDTATREVNLWLEIPASERKEKLPVRVGRLRGARNAQIRAELTEAQRPKFEEWLTTEESPQ